MLEESVSFSSGAENSETVHLLNQLLTDRRSTARLFLSMVGLLASREKQSTFRQVLQETYTMV
jgi:hypothetical protein